MGKETRYKNFENIGYLKGDVQQEPKPSLNREMTLFLGIFRMHVLTAERPSRRESSVSTIQDFKFPEKTWRPPAFAVHSY